MVRLDLADELTIDPAGRRHHGERAVRRRRADRREQPRSGGRWRSSGARPPCTSTSGSPTAGGSAAARRTPPRSCGGPGSPTSEPLRDSAPTSRSASSAAGPGCAASARSSSRSTTSRWSVTLVVPPLHVSTPAVYRAWDALGGPTRNGPQRPRTGGRRRRAGAGSLARPHRRARRRGAGVGRQRGDVVRAGQARRRPRFLAERGRCGRGGPHGASRRLTVLAGGAVTYGAGGGCVEASSCASSCASACGAS